MLATRCDGGGSKTISKECKTHAVISMTFVVSTLWPEICWDLLSTRFWSFLCSLVQVQFSTVWKTWIKSARMEEKTADRTRCMPNNVSLHQAAVQFQFVSRLKVWSQAIVQSPLCSVFNIVCCELDGMFQFLQAISKTLGFTDYHILSDSYSCYPRPHLWQPA